ncbi:conserved hypothetical protein [Verrucomicrobia bacterium]|nr:conserved hypothetical protein [Verrucomicrobiota bacterium]
MADPLVPKASPTLDVLQDLRRLGKNINGYFGETIEINAVLRECVAAAQAHDWVSEDIPVSPGLALLALNRQIQAASGPPELAARRRIYISAGIHGDEPAGPLAVRQLLQEDRWPEATALWICPCLNPVGFSLNRRENSQGADLNRQYLMPTAPETMAHIQWLQRQPPFDLCLCLHEDWEAHGFYLYELNPDHRPSFAENMVTCVEPVCPIDHSDIIEGRPARDGIIRPTLEPHSRPRWPEAFFLITHKTRLSYTLEAPSDFPLPVRVAALVAAVRAALEGPL